MQPSSNEMYVNMEELTPSTNPIPVVHKNPLPVIPAAHHMVNRPLVFDPYASRHAFLLPDLLRQVNSFCTYARTGAGAGVNVG